MMVAPISQAHVAKHCSCGQAMDPSDRFCRACGRTIGEAPWHHKPLVLVVLLFFVIGPLAIPLLWRSSSFSVPVKLILSLMSIGILFWGLYNIANMPLTSLVRVLG